MNRFRRRRWGFWPSGPHGANARWFCRQRSGRPQLEVLEDSRLLAVFTVTTTNEFVAGSLRQAILDANAHPGLNTIAFAIGGRGVQTIQPQVDLPTITNPVIVDGTTQPGYVGSPLIVLRGGYAGTGLLITAGNSTVNRSDLRFIGWLTGF